MINFSIIIGVRNKEKFVQKAIKSCVQQKFNRSKYEVIIINDASTDKSLTKIKKQIRNFKNIKLINEKKKLGPGIARNLGMKYAKGNYILFLDADDYFKNNLLRDLEKNIKKNPDIITFNFDKIVNKKILISQRKDFEKITQNKTKLVKNFLRGDIDGSVIFSCFRKKFIKENLIKFPEGLHEDIIFIFKSYLFSKKTIINRKSFYTKRETQNSITNKIDLIRVKDLLNVHKKILFYLKSKNKYIKEYKYDAYRGFIGYVSDTIIELNNKKKMKKKNEKKNFKFNYSYGY